MTDREIFITLSIALVIVQFLYRIWDKKDNKEIITAIGNGLKSFEPQLERTKKIYAVVKDLKATYSVKDEDGRPLIYMPKEIIETQRELVKLTHTVALTQKYMAELLGRVEEKLTVHGESCKDQFNRLDKKVV